MSTNAYWSMEFTDGIITGRILFKKGECHHCKKSARLIMVADVSLPAGVAPTEKFILYEMPVADLRPIPVVGITCGCYAKAMRQIAYVVGIRKGKGKA